MTEFEHVDILLIEDNPADAELTMRSLQSKRLGNKVTWLKDGAQALDYLFCTGAYADRPQSSKPKLVLLDLKLPKVDGIEVLRRVKSDPNTRTIPIVMLTSSAEERDVIESYQLGVNSYLVKPVDFGAFIDVVSEGSYYWVVLNRTRNE